jgi:hypothetical protein
VGGWGWGGQEEEAEHAENVSQFITESTLHKTGSIVLPKELKHMRSEVCACLYLPVTYCRICQFKRSFNLHSSWAWVVSTRQ